MPTMMIDMTKVSWFCDIYTFIIAKNKCSDRGMEAKLPAQPIDRPTDNPRRTDSVIEVSLPIIMIINS